MAFPLGRIWRMAKISLRRPLTQRRPRRGWVLGLGLVLIVIWQTGFAVHTDHLRAEYGKYRLTAATGLVQQEPLGAFLYFTGYYPLASDAAVPNSRAEALGLIEKRGATLVQEVGLTTSSILRNGDHLRIYLLLVDALWKNNGIGLTPRPANIMGWVLALMGLFFSFWWVGRAFLGILLVMLLGSHPYPLYEIFIRSNVFGWTVIGAVATLALVLPLLDYGRPDAGGKGLCSPGARRVQLLMATGILLGTLRHIRTENALILLSAMAAVFFLGHLSKKNRMALVVVLLGSFAVTNFLWKSFFRYKILESYDLVVAKGGFPHPEAKDPNMNHLVWFPIWTGLGDYGADHGYQWLDVASHLYVKRVLKEKYNQDFPTLDGSGYLVAGKFLDAKKRYAQVPYVAPHYAEIIEDKIKGDIKADPLWYLGILCKRARDVFADMPPVRFAVTNHHVGFRFQWFFYPLTLLLMAVARNRLFVKLLLFFLPLSIPPIAVYSKDGMLYTSMYYLPAYATACLALVCIPLWWKRRKRLTPIGGSRKTVSNNRQRCPI